MLYKNASCAAVSAREGEVQLGVQWADPPRHQTYLRIKAAVEWFWAVLMCVPALPFILIGAAMVKVTSPGPVFYSQKRLGRNGKIFKIYKLRTMTHNCEAKSGPVWSSASDARVTRVGRILRDTHLDELPQLWNVLKGEMGLIGPRPERPELAAKIGQAMPSFHQRLLVKPGVTGLAQVQLPADSDLQSVRLKLAYDLYYVREVSLTLDLRIVVGTGLHFFALALGCVSKVLVKPDVDHVRRNYERAQIVDEDAFHMGAA